MIGFKTLAVPEFWTIFIALGSNVPDLWPRSRKL